MTDGERLPSEEERRRRKDASEDALRRDIVYLAGEYSTWIGVLGVLVVLVVGLALWQFQISLPKIPDWASLPQWAQLLIATVPGSAVVTLLFYAVLKALGLLDWLAQPDWINVYEVDFVRENAEKEGTAEPVTLLNHYKFGPHIWENRTTVEGNMYRSESDTGTVRCARRVDVDEENKSIELHGPWMAEETDVAMLAEKQKIEANRGKIREWAVYGQNLHSKLPTVVQAIESAYWRAMTNEDLEDEALHPDIVRSHVSDDIEHFVESVEKPGEGDSAGEDEGEGSDESGDGGSMTGNDMADEVLAAEDLSPPDAGGDGV